MGRKNLRFTVAMAAFVVFTLIAYREEVLGVLLAPLTLLTAQTTTGLLHWWGMEAARTATTISHPSGFSYEIYYRCTGFLPTAFLATAILSCRGRAFSKILGLAVGIPLLLALNLARLVHLYLLGVHQRDVFDVAHRVVWETIMVLAVATLWLVWLRWSGRIADPGQETSKEPIRVPA